MENQRKPGQRGRLTTYKQEIADEICRRIADGQPLREMCREEGMPAWTTVYSWLNANPDFAERYARARDTGHDAIAEDTIAMVDEKPERTDTQFGDKVDPGYVQWQKNRVEQRLKLLAKWNPKRYGDRQQVDLSGSLSLNEMSDDEIRQEIALLATTGVKPIPPAETAADDCADLY